MSARVNWPIIGKFFWTLAKIGVIGSVPLLVYSCIKNEVESEQALKDVSVVTQDEATYTLIDSDSVKMEKNKLIYFFNFDMRHLTIKGKIADYNLDTTYTFDQYTDQSRIQDVRERACQIASNFAKVAINESTPETVKKGQSSAIAFAANHCPQPTPGGNG